MVVIVGGYASFPAGLAAVLTRVPLVSVTTDAVPGAVNGLLGRFAAANAVAFPGTNLPREHVTGTPVRSELASLDRTPEGRAGSRAALGLPPDRQTVATVGGSLGALRINRAVAELAGTWAGCEGRSLYQVTGRRDYGAFSSSPPHTPPPPTPSRPHTPPPPHTPSPPPSCSRPGGSGSPEESGTTTAGAPLGAADGDDAGGRERLWHRVVPFEDRMWLLYGAADVCVTRAGAMTVAELLVTGVPAILVPLPGAPRDHQTRNAEALVGMGAAVHLPDAECDGRRLAEELDALLSDPDRLRAMREAAQRARAPRRGGPCRRAGRRPCPLTRRVWPARPVAPWTSGAPATSTSSASAERA